MPKVSVCIPTYNTARYLGEAIESVLAQTFTDYELIVSDNASTDATPEICSRYQDHPAFRCVRYEELVGQGGNWNRCLSHARGEYVALLHSDDRYLPDFLERRVRVLERYPGVGLAFGAVRLIDPHGAPAGEQVFAPESFVNPEPEFLKDVLMGCVINPVSPMVRRRCYEEVGTFREDRLWGIDWDMWLRLAARYGVAYACEISAEYRIHGGSGTASGIAQAKNGREELEVLEAALAAIDRAPELRRFARYRRAAYRRLALRTLYVAGCCAEQGNVAGVKANLYWTLRIDPTLASRPSVWAMALSSCLGSSAVKAVHRARFARAA
jgi:glycosyltransferase involved in cell wall biosynthesis